jgi:hypothetical protein
MVKQFSTFSGILMLMPREWRGEDVLKAHPCNVAMTVYAAISELVSEGKLRFVEYLEQNGGTIAWHPGLSTNEQPRGHWEFGVEPTELAVGHLTIEGEASQFPQPSKQEDLQLKVGGDFNDVLSYATTPEGALDLSKMQELEGRLGGKCDVNKGPCACGAWH